MKIHPLVVLWTAICLGNVCNAADGKDASNRLSIDYTRFHRELLGVITNKASPPREVELAIAHLGSASEKPSFWSSIANDEAYSFRHRQACIMALFRRHGQQCTGVRELARILNRPTWLRDEDIEVADVLGGWIPAHANYTVFQISVFPVKTVYGHQLNAASVLVSVMGKVDREVFSKGVRGLEVESPLIWDVGLKGLYEEPPR